MNPHGGRLSGRKKSRESIRYKAYFHGPSGERQRLQIDTRYRPRPVSKDIVIVDGIQTYSPTALFDQKLAAQRSRDEARDIYDLAFLSKRYGDKLTKAQINRAESITRDMDGLEQALTKQLRKDRILAQLTTAEYIVLEFRVAVEAQMQRREMTIAEQSVPISVSMKEEINALRRLLHGESVMRLGDGHSLLSANRKELDQRDSIRSVQQPDWFDR